MTLFANKTTIVAELRSDRLILAGGNFFKASVLTEDYIYGKLLAAEADAARRLRVLLEPTKVFAGPPTAAEIAAAESNPWMEEPAYDFDQDAYVGDRWGLISTRQRPVIAVQSLAFIYPAPTVSTFNVPLDWLRIDKKYGQIRVVPTGVSASSPIAMYLMQTIGGGGRSVPQMLVMRYTAGLSDAASKYPDLIDLIKKMAVLRIVQDSFAPQSGSISADGLSQSFSADMEKYQDGADRMLNSLKDAMHGVRLVVA